MKIATITCHNVYNYGASLQAYALQRYLSQAGHDVQIIDYKPYYLNSRYNWRHIPAESRLYPYKDYIGTQCIYFLLKNRKIYKTIGRKRKFDDFRQKFLTLTDNTYTSAEELRATPPQADLYIAGSDQIWNTACENGKDAAFYLDSDPTTHGVSPMQPVSQYRRSLPHTGLSSRKTAAIRCDIGAGADRGKNNQGSFCRQNGRTGGRSGFSVEQTKLGGNFRGHNTPRKVCSRI